MDLSDLGSRGEAGNAIPHDSTASDWCGSRPSPSVHVYDPVPTLTREKNAGEAAGPTGPAA